MWFPPDTQKATLINGVWEIDFGPYNTNRVVEAISLQGPIGSSVTVYIDTIFYDITPRGDANRADYPNPIPLAKGRQLRLVWNAGTGSALATLQMSDGKRQVAGLDNESIFRGEQ